MLIERRGLAGAVRGAAADTEIFVNPTGPVLEAARAVRGCAYARAGAEKERQAEALMDRYESAPNTMLLALRRAGAMIGSLRLTVYDNAAAGGDGDGPAAMAFADTLREAPELSGRIVDHSRLSVSREALDIAGTHLLLFAVSYIAARRLGGSCAVAAVFTHHARFYEKVFGIARLGPPRLVPPFPLDLQLVYRRYDDIADAGFERAPVVRDIARRWDAAMGEMPAPPADGLHALHGTL